MQKTDISWAKNPDGTQGFTSNPVKGKCPIGCSFCYAEKIRKHYGWPERLSFHVEELSAIKRRKKPAGIFLGSMIDLFHKDTCGPMPEILETIRACPQHRFYMLTKCPENLHHFTFPDNVYLGVTVTDQAMADRSIPYLLSAEAKVRYLSIEPLLGPLDPGFYLKVRFGKVDTGEYGQLVTTEEPEQKINWLIIGAQSKPTIMPKIEWVKTIVESCDKAGVPMFLKDSLIPILPTDNPLFYPYGKLRQEVPLWTVQLKSAVTTKHQ